jgi:hypothetical protein
MPEPTGDYEPSGEVLFSAGESASFNSIRVRAPNMNLSRRTDGSWSGTFDDEAFDVSVTEKYARGVGLMLALDENDAQGFRAEGAWQGRRFRFELKPDNVAIRSDRANFDLKRGAESAYGSHGELKLRGEAGTMPCAWPQTAFALLSLFN